MRQVAGFEWDVEGDGGGVCVQRPGGRADGWDGGIYTVAFVTVPAECAAERTVYAGSGDGVLYALDGETGREVWRYDLGVPTLSSPALSGTGLWTGACDGFVYAFSGGC